MSESNEGITLTIKAKDMTELKQKLMSQLAELGIKVSEGEEDEEEAEIDFSDEIKEIYPDYGDNCHSAAMLTVLHENHRGRTNRVSSWVLAREMKERFPDLFYRRSLKSISWGNIFPGSQLEEQGLLHIELGRERRRSYWV